MYLSLASARKRDRGHLSQQTHVCPSILLDARNAATALGVGRSLFYQLCARRIGPLSVKLGERSLWARAELEAWAAAGCPTRGEWLRQKPSP
jgi:predicted DNA-binding transcriptional regulator AlpA